MLFRFIPEIVERRFSALSGNQRAGLLGMGWSTLGQITSLAVKLGSTLVLTRLLAPEAYGILGTAMAVLTTLEWLSDLGIQPALIRHPRGGTREFLETGWLMGLLRGAFLTAAAAGLAFPLSRFYHQPTLLGVLLVIAVRPLVLSLRSPAYPTLRRKLDYRALFIDEIAMTFVGTLCSIVMALYVPSVWAIVLGTMTGAFVSVFVSYVLCPMIPKIRWDGRAASDVYGFGKHVFVNTLAMAISLNLDRLLGLRLLSPTAMGMYAIAFNLACVLEGMVTRACDVYFSLLAREEDSSAQVRWHQRISHEITRHGMPVAALFSLASPCVIWILYDARYREAGVVFGILLIRLMVRTLGQLQFQYLMAVAQVRIATFAYVVAILFQIAFFAPVVNAYGVTGLALTMFASTMVMTLTQSLLLQRREGDGMRPFLRTTAWAVAGIIAMFAVYDPSPVMPGRSTTANNLIQRANTTESTPSDSSHPSRFAYDRYEPEEFQPGVGEA